MGQPHAGSENRADLRQDVFRQAVALHQRGDVDRALQIYDQLLQQDPDHPGALHLKGVVHHGRGEDQVALQLIGRALQLCGHKAVYHNNYGVVLRKLGRHAEAKAAFERAAALRPDYADAWSNRGLAESDLEDLQAAVRSLQHALQLDPRHADALLHLAGVMRRLDRIDEAISYYEQAIAVRPGHVESRIELAESLAAADRWTEAEQAYRTALQANPGDAGPLLRISKFLANCDRPGEAEPYLRRAAELRPEKALWPLKRCELCPPVFPDRESIDAYWERLERELDRALEQPPAFDWRDAVTDGFTYPFNLPHHLRCCRAVREKFAALFAHAFPHQRPPLRRGQRTRVGFLVTRGHELGFLRGTAGIINRLDMDRFEVTLLAARGGIALCRKAIRRDGVAWVTLPDRFDQAAETARDAACDVIYYWKVGADPLNYFLPFTRPAPLQCTSWGTHGTSGLTAVDDYLSSRLIERDDADEDYTERLYRGDTLPTWQPRPHAMPACSPAEFGLPERGAIYLCPHRPGKYHPDFDALFAGLLDRDPAGTIVLLAGKHEHPKQILRQRLQRTLGAALCDRVVFLPLQSGPDFERLVSAATVVLDSAAYAGGLTAYDAFAHGVPVVTQEGRLAVQRYTAALYRRLEMPDLISTTPEQYIDSAVRLGTDEGYRRDVTERLRERSSVLFEDPTAVTAHEQFFEYAVERGPPGP